MENTNKVLNAALTAVSVADVPGLKNILELLDLGKLQAATLKKLISILLIQAHKSDASQEIYSVIINAVDSTVPNPNETPALGAIFRWSTLSVDHVNHMVRKLGLGYNDLIMAIGVYPSGPETVEAYKKINALYPNIPAEMVMEMLKFLESQSLQQVEAGSQTILVSQTEGNESLKELLLAKYNSLSSVVPTPSWINGEKIFLLPPTEDYIVQDPTSSPKDLPEPDQYAKMLLDKMLPSMVNPEERELQKFFRSMSSEFENSATLEMKLILLLPLYADLYLKDSDIEAKRRWGPANPYITFGGYGGKMSSRMLTCVKYFDDDIDYEDVELEVRPFDWFTGNCDSCGKKISQYHYAVRMPMPNGGWVGCYCSWKHVRGDIFKPDPGTEEVSPAKIKTYLSHYFEKVLQEVGIQDRFPLEEEPRLLMGQEKVDLFNDLGESASLVPQVPVLFQGSGPETPKTHVWGTLISVPEEVVTQSPYDTYQEEAPNISL